MLSSLFCKGTFFWSVVFFWFILAQAVYPVSAQADNIDGYGIKVTPIGESTELVYEYNLGPGESRTGSFKITHEYNPEDTPLRMTIEILDFTIDNETGEVKLLEDQTTFGLSEYISIEKNEFILERFGLSEVVDFELSTPDDIDPGSYFSLIQVRTNFADETESGNLGINFAVAPVLFANIAGPSAFSQVKIDSFTSPEIVWDEGSLDFETKLANEGNRLVVPEGKIVILDRNEQTIEEIELNPRNNRLLPESAVFFDNNWETDNKLSFGSYTVRLEVFDPQTNEFVNVERSFWFIPVRQIATIVIASIVLLIVIGGGATLLLEPQIRKLIGKRDPNVSGGFNDL